MQLTFNKLIFINKDNVFIGIEEIKKFYTPVIWI